MAQQRRRVGRSRILPVKKRMDGSSPAELSSSPDAAPSHPSVELNQAEAAPRENDKLQNALELSDTTVSTIATFADRPVLPPELVALILPKRGVSPEEREAFADLERKVTEIFKAGDVFDQFMISRVVNLMWDCSSITRYQNSFLSNSREASLKKILDGRVENARMIAEDVRKGDKRSIQIAHDTLSKSGLSDEDLHAQSFIHHLETIERLKRIEAMALKDMHRLLRELDYRKMVREQIRLRQLWISLREARLLKYGTDVEMEIPK